MLEKRIRRSHRWYAFFCICFLFTLSWTAFFQVNAAEEEVKESEEIEEQEEISKKEPDRVVILSKKSKGKKFTFTWSSVEEAEGYHIYRRRKDEKKWMLLGTTQKTKYSDTTMKNGRRYFYKVAAFNEAGEGEKSKFVSVVRVKKIQCGGNKLTLELGEKKQLTIKLVPQNPTNKKLVFSSSDKNIVTVSQKGKLRAKNPGTAVILIHSVTGAEKKLKVTVKKKARIVAIDAGHQLHGDSSLEPMAPGSSQMKAKVASGTCGTATGVPEYQLNLTVSLKLETELKKRGYEVVMIRRTNEVNISNSERAKIANSSGAEIFVRVHANGGAPSARGILTMSPTSSNPYIGSKFAECNALSTALVNHMCARTGAINKGVIYTDSMSGINWCTIPVSIVEMGFMTNEAEDRLMQTDSYQNQLVMGMADGIDEYFLSH